MSDDKKTDGLPEAVKKSALTRVKEGFFYKNGQFSKTATFATLGTFLVLNAYVLSWFAGTTLTFGSVGTVTLPEFNSGAAVALLGILNGTYLGNNLIKTRTPVAKPGA